MTEVFSAHHNIISPLGFTSEETYVNMREGKSGIKRTSLPDLYPEPVHISHIDRSEIDRSFSALADVSQFTTAEKLLLLSISQVFSSSGLHTQNPETLIIISTTKGNIDLLEENKKKLFPSERVHLWSLSDTVQKFFSTPVKPLILSNACISGVNALICGTRLIRDGQYKHVIVAGVDILSSFVISGFQAFKAFSASPCKPFDKNRDGINLGEACGTILLTADKNIAETAGRLKITGGGISNDANHISGPSRTGDGLYLAINSAMNEAGISAKQIDTLNAHGTATIYNDEMESKAFRWAELQDVPMNGYKGYFGHTLGAAGTIETIISMEALKRNEILPTTGYQEPGTTEKLNVTSQLLKKEINTIIKTASGFGGCNAAIIITRA